MRALAYLRVSTDEQADSGAGLAAQRGAISSEADRRGWELTWITDAGYSAKSLRRPGIIEALELLRTGQADALVVSKLDRLSRSTIDFCGLLQLAQRQGWALVSLDFGLDMTTPAGEMVASVMAVIAQWERRVIAERTRLALAEKKRAGMRLGRPPLTPATVRAQIVELRGQGLSLQAIADRLNAEGVPTAMGGVRWYHSTVSKVLGSQWTVLEPAS